MSDQNEVKVSQLSNIVYLNRTFEMKNFSEEKAKDKSVDWKSPAMYTHACGYKFCIGVDANGYLGGHGKSIYVDLWSMPGKYDKQLNWPASAKFTIELLNQQGGENATCIIELNWEKPRVAYKSLAYFSRIKSGFLEHSKLNSFLKNDTIYFCISEVQLL